VTLAICIHGHFYQPPRENPWLEAVEFQDGAYPYHDWNERITAECYAPNAIARILDKEGRIAQLVNNYTRISFNFGPTLLSWLEKAAPEVYAAILQADRESQKRFSGHGSALAQAYNHMIMPLANSRDKRTQVIWGIADFVYRFGRRPEGMWLPETAVDLETLDIMAEQGILFTILAPRQAGQVRKLGEGQWRDVSGERIDTRMPYACRLPSGRQIALFFYDGWIAHDVAFGNLLNSGEVFASRLMGVASDAEEGRRLVHIATDGETYGHHRHFGDMALAYALHAIESGNRARLTNYGSYLEENPPSHEVEILENTSWSCVHGIERWRSDCGCNTGAHPGWNQAWRAPLRQALDWLRDAVAPAYEKRSRAFLKDPWHARDAYIKVILDRSPAGVNEFFHEHAVKELSDAEKIETLKLLELQRHSLLMYTSCGWFFDDLSGIETIQVLQYAGRTIQLAQEIFGDGIEPAFLSRLVQAKSNIPAQGDGRVIYERSVRPAMVDLQDVGAHYAITALFDDSPVRSTVYCYTADQKDYRIVEAGRARLGIGRAEITSEITRESADLCFGVLHWGDQTINCGVRAYREEKSYQAMRSAISRSFDKGDLPATIRLMDKHFGTSRYSLKSLFYDGQRKIVNLIMASTLNDAEKEYQLLYASHAPMIRFLNELKIPPPKAISAAAEVAINAGLRRAIEGERLDAEEIEALLNDAIETGVSLDAPALEFAFRKKIERMLEDLRNRPADVARIKEIEGALELAGSLPFHVNLWQAQNIFYELMQDVYKAALQKADQADKKARKWLKHFQSLGARLYILVEKGKT
jgi:alpha-amylase/alpha-mannosidase (GH57 family)